MLLIKNSLVVQVVVASLQPDNLKVPYMQKLKTATASDLSYRELLQAVKTGFPEKKQEAKGVLRHFWRERADLSVSDGFILKGKQIIVSVALRMEVLADLHPSHQGTKGTQRRARQTVF